ncbi:hypothetical protein [Amycolatopsis sp. Poz14]|uniref:hypothetical protein n=1 Tax=Amycolatopsis sp. Poz14 TaxID=1447705 RepID=UPI0035ABCD4D
MPHRRPRAVRSCHRDRPPPRARLDPHGRRLDGVVARPRHREPSRRPGIRPGRRPRRRPGAGSRGAGASQEHGILTAREGHPLPDLPTGTRLRILPNHACATAAQHSGYRILENGRLVDTWQRMSGW